MKTGSFPSVSRAGKSARRGENPKFAKTPAVMNFFFAGERTRVPRRVISPAIHGLSPPRAGERERTRNPSPRESRETFSKVESCPVRGLREGERESRNSRRRERRKNPRVRFPPVG
jgi:hypothetical protein